MISGSLPSVRCGIGDYTARLASALARRRDVTVQVLTTRSPAVQTMAAAPAEVLSPVAGWGLASVLRSAARLRRLRPDIVHVQYPAVGYARALGVLALPLAARRLARVPVVLTVHERRQRRWHGRLATDVMALTSNLVIVPDPLEATALRQHLRRFRTRVEVAEMISTVPVNGSVDRHASRARLGLSGDALVMGTFGLIHPRRRLEDLVDALACLRGRSVNGHLLIIGGEAAYDVDVARTYISALKRRIADLHLVDQVTWVGYVENADVSVALQACDVCVLLYPDGASRRNTTLQAALEHGLQVVTTDGPATSPSLRQTPSIHLLRARAYRPDELAEAILAAFRGGSTEGSQTPVASPLEGQVDWHLKIYREVLS